VEISDEDDPGEGGDQPEIEAGAGAGTTVENAIDLAYVCSAFLSFLCDHQRSTT
jgi:hypothetical protein